jgi:glyoxylase-like metal-dependent hydrolase (beta-lactamase superfamily II)
MAWHYKEVVFGGDAVFGGDSIAPAPSVFSADPDLAEKSIEKLKHIEFSTLLDGHNGITDDAHLLLP